MKDLLIYSLIVASISFLISEAAIFNKLRIKTKLRSVFFGKLIYCGYCLSYYIAIPIMLIFQPRLFFIFMPLDYFFTWIILVWISSFQWAVMCVLFKISGK